MLKNTQIAQNLTVDLSECRDLLDTMDKGKFTWMAYNYQKTNNQQPINTMTYEELSSINAYLESKGLTTDGQKAEYLASALDEIAHRGENQDEELKNLLLTRHSTLTYADGISESRIDNINMYRIQKDGKEYHIPDTLLTQIHEKIRQGNLDNDNLKFDLSPLQEMPQDVLLAENEMPSQMPSITLTPSERQEISNDMRHDRLNYDRELSEQTEALSHPISQAEQEQTAEHQPSAQTISPTMMKSLQQNTR